MRTTIGGKSIPVVLLVTLLVIAGAGQSSTGVTLQGDVQSESTTKAEQAVNVTSVAENSSDPAHNFAGSASDDGTAFRTGANVNQGMDYAFDVHLTNNGDENLNATLKLDVPSPLEVEVAAPGSNLNKVRIGMGTWYLGIGSDTDDDPLTITVAVPDDAQPGFYTIEGAIQPTGV